MPLVYWLSACQWMWKKHLVLSDAYYMGTSHRQPHVNFPQYMHTVAKCLLKDTLMGTTQT